MSLRRLATHNRIAPTLLLLTLYLLLTLILTWPTITHFTTHLPGDGGDDPAIAWNLWWIKYALLNEPQNPFQTDFMFYPIGINLAFYTLTLLNGLTALPLTLNGGVVLASNLHLFFSFMVGGYGVFLLSRYLLMSASRVAWLSAASAGLFFTFASNKLFYVALGQFNIASSHWLPFAILYLVRLHHRPDRLKNAVLAGLFFTMQAWTEMTYASFLLIFLGLYWLYWGSYLGLSRLAGRDRTQLPVSAFIRAVGLLGLLVITGLSPILAQMLPDMLAEGDFLVEGSGFAEDFSADLAGFIVPTRHHPFLGYIIAQTGITGFNLGQHIYIGFTLLGLAGLAAATTYRRPSFWFWLGAAFLFALLCLGPVVLIKGQITTIPGPFVILQQLPFFNGNRYPSRFSVMLILSLAVVAAFGMAQAGLWLAQRYRSPRADYISLSLLALLFLFEHLSLPLPQSDMRVPAPYRLIMADPAEATVLDIPFAWRNGFRITGAFTTQFMFGQFYQTQHQKRLLQGNTSRNPEFKFQYFTNAPVINSLLALQTGKTLPPERWEADRAIAAEVLDFFNIRYIVVRPDPTNNPIVTPQAVLPYIDTILPARLIYEDAALKLYQVTSTGEADAAANLTITPADPLAPLYFGEGWGLIQPGQPAAAQRRSVRLLLPLQAGAYRFSLQLRLPEGMETQTLSLEMNGWQAPAQPVEPGQSRLIFDIPATAIKPGLNDLYLHFGEIVALPPPAPGVPIVDITLISAGEEVGDFGHIFVNGYDVSANSRGYNLAVIQPDGAVRTAHFDTHQDPTASQHLSQYLAEADDWPPGAMIAVAAADEASAQLEASAVQALRHLGAGYDLRGCVRCSHVLLSRVDTAPHLLAEALDPLRPVAVTSSLGLTEPQLAALVEAIQIEKVK